MNMTFFLEMAWKSSYIAGVALLLAMLLKSRSPADRAVVLQVGLGLLVLLPLVSLFFPAWQVEMAAEEAQPLVGSLLHYAPANAAVAAAAELEMQAAASAAPQDPAPILALLYLGGLAFALARLLGGLSTLRRWTSVAETVSCPRWTQALERVSGGAAVQLRVSDEVQAPLSWGWRRPVILIDAEAYKRASDADAILAHEMAHIVRRDWPALMLSRIAAALFWFNPLVWLLGRAFVRHAEEAADCQALAQVEPTHYAQVLLGCASHAGRGAIPANSMATSDLSKRVHAILQGSGRAIPPGSRLCVATIIGCLALAGPVSAMKLIPEAAADAVESLAPVAPKTPAIVRQMIEPVRVATPLPQPAPAAAPVTAPEAPVAAATPQPVAVPEAVSVSLAAAEPVSPKPAPLLLASSAAPTKVAAPAQRDDRDSYAAAMREANVAHAELARVAERASKASEAAAAIARRQARQSMARGALDMENGAENMKQGARNMAEEAVKLRDPAYREQQIARQRLRGQTVTHQQLIDAIPQLERGSRDMLRGAEDMRRGAEQMRRSAER
jgi:beta-lactamase regulating signal transducer with metallopeptidase domain